MQIVSGPLGREVVHYECTTLGASDCRVGALLGMGPPSTRAPPVGATVVNAHCACCSRWCTCGLNPCHPFEDGNGRSGVGALADMALSVQDMHVARLRQASIGVGTRVRHGAPDAQDPRRRTTDERSASTSQALCAAIAPEADDLVGRQLLAAWLWSRYASPSSAHAPAWPAKRWCETQRTRRSSACGQRSARPMNAEVRPRCWQLPAGSWVC